MIEDPNSPACSLQPSWNVGKVRHVITSSHQAQSNGNSESAVKSTKHLVMKVASSGNIDCEEFDRRLLELLVRNTPMHAGRSLAQVLYGRPQRSCVLAHSVSFQEQWQARPEGCHRRAAHRARYISTRYDQYASSFPTCASTIMSPSRTSCHGYQQAARLPGQTADWPSVVEKHTFPPSCHTHLRGPPDAW